MFYHYPSSRLSPSVLKANHPLLYFFEPKIDSTGALALEPSSDDKIDGTDDGSKAFALYRGDNVYIEDAKDTYTITLDVPGVKIQDVKLEVKDSVLFVSAERKVSGKTIAKLAQNFALDETLVDTESFRASLADGVLTITAAKKEESAPLTVQITTSEPASVGESGLYLTLDVPGIKVGDMKIEFHKGNLSVFGERIKMNPHGKRQVVAKVSRTFQVKDKLIDTSKIQAYLSDGVLTVTAPPKPAGPAKLIEIPTTSSNDNASSMEKEVHPSDDIVVETVTNDDEQ